MPTPRLDADVLQETWEAFRKANGNVTQAAASLGLIRGTFQVRLARAFEEGYEDIRQSTHFHVDPIPSRQRNLDELLAHRRKESERMRAADAAENIIGITLKTDGPIGLAVFGDPHIDAPGCDFNLLESHLGIVAKRNEYVFAGNIGDLHDNWIGRLSRLYESTTITGKETWQLVEWMMNGCGVRWTWLIRGNHDAWSGKNDPLDWIAKSAGVGVDKHWGARLRFRHPNGTDTMIHARHDFTGNSQFNPLHGLKKETLHGSRDDIIIAGHRHSGADARDVNGDGHPFVMVRTSGYKVSDTYAYEKGFHPKPLHPAAMIIVNPDEPRGSHSRIWVAPCLEVGADYLDFLRKRFNTRPRTAPKKGKQT